MKAKAIMVQGTSSGAGKSLLCLALCRHLASLGRRVTPFKAVNMSLNAHATAEGEIAWAQAIQARAAGVEPHPDMNPVLLKPLGDRRCQVVVHGRAIGIFPAARLGSLRDRLWPAIRKSYERLTGTYEVVVVEGAGSPAEVNLRDRDWANMKIARIADAPVILVADIYRGGALASVVGTLALLRPEERRRVKGIVINRFCGDPGLLENGLRFLEKKTGKPVLGVIPETEPPKIGEEDSLAFSEGIASSLAAPAPRNDAKVRIAVVRLPHISNFTDFAPLQREAGVDVRFVRSPRQAEGCQVWVLPGTRSATKDAEFLRRSGWAEGILPLRCAQGQNDGKDRKGPGKEIHEVVGICGGFQLLGAELRDPFGVEGGPRRTSGLGLLPVTTVYRREKRTGPIRALHLASGKIVEGYEIHHGEIQTNGAPPCFQILSRGGTKSMESLRKAGERRKEYEGASARDGRVWGTQIHGLFENRQWRRWWLSRLSPYRGGSGPAAGSPENDFEKETARWTRHVEKSLNMKRILGWLR